MSDTPKKTTSRKLKVHQFKSLEKEISNYETPEFEKGFRRQYFYKRLLHQNEKRRCRC